MPIDHFSDVQIYNIHCYSFSQVFLSVLSLFFLCSSSTPFPGGGGDERRNPKGRVYEVGGVRLPLPQLGGGAGKQPAGFTLRQLLHSHN